MLGVDIDITPLKESEAALRRSLGELEATQEALVRKKQLAALGEMAAIVAHEVPQEAGDFIVLLNAGFSRGRALFYNALSGLAGSLFAMAQQSAYPNVMSLHNSGYVVMMVLIGGGLVSFWGPVIGALVFLRSGGSGVEGNVGPGPVNTQAIDMWRVIRFSCTGRKWWFQPRTRRGASSGPHRSSAASPVCHPSSSTRSHSGAIGPLILMSSPNCSVQK